MSWPRRRSAYKLHALAACTVNVSVPLLAISQYETESSVFAVWTHDLRTAAFDFKLVTNEDEVRDAPLACACMWCGRGFQTRGLGAAAAAPQFLNKFTAVVWVSPSDDDVECVSAGGQPGDEISPHNPPLQVLCAAVPPSRPACWICRNV
jgi:hypothetical protein